MPAKTMTEREAFEAWLIARDEVPYATAERKDGSYIIPRSQNAWEAWQAARQQDEALLRGLLTNSLRVAEEALAAEIEVVPLPHGEIDVAGLILSLRADLNARLSEATND